MLELIAAEIWVFGSICAYFLAPTRAAKSTVLLLAFGLLILGGLWVWLLTQQQQELARKLELDRLLGRY